MMRVLVTGGRNYGAFHDHVLKVGMTLTDLHRQQGISLLIHGDHPNPRSADQLADKWAEKAGVDRVKFPANWSHGNSGGPWRNGLMIALIRPDLVVAFPGGNGTADAVRKADNAGIKIMMIG